MCLRFATRAKIMPLNGCDTSSRPNDGRMLSLLHGKKSVKTFSKCFSNITKIERIFTHFRYSRARFEDALLNQLPSVKTKQIIEPGCPTDVHHAGALWVMSQSSFHFSRPHAQMAPPFQNLLFYAIFGFRNVEISFSVRIRSGALDILESIGP